MGIWQSLRCSTGSHDWEDWSYVQRDDARDCSQQRRCRGCAKQETRMAHTLLDWRYARESGDCVKIMSCGRCLQAVQHKVEHSLGQWRSDGSPCRSTSPCSHCGVIEECFQHSFAAWNYAGPKTCDQLRLCARCSEREEHQASDADHEEWSEWEYQHSFHCELFKRHCLRCGLEQVERRRARHVWNEGEFISQTKRRRRCVRCKSCDFEHYIEK
jgi:hypothetical protein